MMCVIAWGGGSRYVDEITMDQLEDKRTHKEIVDGIYEYHMFNLEVRDMIKHQPEFISIDNIEKDVFVLFRSGEDVMIILETSKYYKWFTMVEDINQDVVSQVVDIILDSPNKELIVYKNGVRKR